MNTKQTKQAVIKNLENMPVIQVACKQSGVSRATYYRWLKSDKEFKRTAEEAQAEGVKLINELAVSKLITSINEQNMTGIIFWLKNNHSAYRDRLEVTAKNDKEPLTKEQQIIIEKALSLSPLKLPNQSKNEADNTTDSETSNKGSKN